VTTSVVSLSALESALDTLLAVSDENEYQRIQVFNAFEIPCLKYNINTNGYELKPELNRSLIASTEYRINLFRQR
jgi:DNA polymerase epsilon subunit 2